MPPMRGRELKLLMFSDLRVQLWMPPMRGRELKQFTTLISDMGVW